MAGVVVMVVVVVNSRLAIKRSGCRRDMVLFESDNNSSGVGSNVRERTDVDGDREFVLGV